MAMCHPDVLAMSVLAQSMPGHALVPCVLAFGAFGYLAGLAGLVCALARVPRLALGCALVAFGSVCGNELLAFAGHEFSVTGWLNGMAREWRLTVVFNLPLIFVVATVTVVCFRRGPQTGADCGQSLNSTTALELLKCFAHDRR